MPRNVNASFADTKSRESATSLDRPGRASPKVTSIFWLAAESSSADPMTQSGDGDLPPFVADLSTFNSGATSTMAGSDRRAAALGFGGGW